MSILNVEIPIPSIQMGYFEFLLDGYLNIWNTY